MNERKQEFYYYIIVEQKDYKLFKELFPYPDSRYMCCESSTPMKHGFYVEKEILIAKDMLHIGESHAFKR